jgi:hypothetical protein
MNSRFLTALTIATVTFLSFSSIAKAEDAAQPDVSAPEPTVVIQDPTQTTTDTNSQSQTVDRNSNVQPDSTNPYLRSSGGNNEDKCDEQ